MLKKKDKLPMVAFTFSKRRIEDNVLNLQSVDLTTQAEKSEIHIFLHRCIQRLKGNDRQLPQVRPPASFIGWEALVYRVMIP